MRYVSSQIFSCLFGIEPPDLFFNRSTNLCETFYVQPLGNVSEWFKELTLKDSGVLYEDPYVQVYLTSSYVSCIEWIFTLICVHMLAEVMQTEGVRNLFGCDQIL